MSTLSHSLLRCVSVSPVSILEKHWPIFVPVFYAVRVLCFGLMFGEFEHEIRGFPCVCRYLVERPEITHPMPNEFENCIYTDLYTLYKELVVIATGEGVVKKYLLG